MANEAKPYVVRTIAGTFHSEWSTIEQAKQAAAQANKQAEALEIEARYEAAPR